MVKRRCGLSYQLRWKVSKILAQAGHSYASGSRLAMDVVVLGLGPDEDAHYRPGFDYARQ